MKILHRASLVLFLLPLLALTGEAQRSKPGPGDGPVNPNGPGGGGHKGPGDTVPNGGSGSGGGSNPSGPVGPDPNSPGPNNGTNKPYIPLGFDPLSPPTVPGSTPGSSSEPAPITPSSRPRTETPTSWQIWWHYNRWAYLAQVPGLADTGTGGFFIGRGQRSPASPTLRVSRAQIQEIVQPALLKATRLQGSPDLEIAALHALAKLRGAESDPNLGSFDDAARISMRSGNQEVAEKAVLFLGVRGDVAHLPTLVSILRDEPEGRAAVGRQRCGLRLRTFAAYALGLLGERVESPGVRVQIYDALVQSLWLERVEVQSACLMAIGMTPMPAHGEFVEDSELFLGKTRIDQINELIRFFEDTERQAFVSRSQAPAAIARLVEGAPESLRARAIDAMLTASGTHSKELREVQNAAVIALGQMARSAGDPLDAEVLDHLTTVAYKSSADRSTRFFAMTALAEAARRRGQGDEPFAGVEMARDVFLANLNRSRGETQAWTALALGILEGNAAERGAVPAPESGRALRKIFKKTRSHEVAGALALALGMLRDLESEELLTERMVTAGEENVRGYTALALGMMGATNSITPIRDLLTRSTMQPFVVENAAIALSLLGDQEVGAKLYEILSDSPRPSVQASVASAMGWIKDPRPLSKLCDQLLDARKNETGRSWTAVAIGRICDEDRWPWVGRCSVNAQFDVWLPTLLEPTTQDGLLDIP